MDPGNQAEESSGVDGDLDRASDREEPEQPKTAKGKTKGKGKSPELQRERAARRIAEKHVTIPMDRGGWCRMDDVTLAMDMERAEVVTLVYNCAVQDPKHRFQIATLEKNDSQVENNPAWVQQGPVLIRCVQGHSLRHLDLPRLSVVMSPDQVRDTSFPVIAHGTKPQRDVEHWPGARRRHRARRRGRRRPNWGRLEQRHL